MTDSVVKDATDKVLAEYQSLGGTDQVAKGPELKKRIRTVADVEILIG